MPYILLIIAVVALDQKLKLMFVEHIGMFNEMPVIDGFFYFHVIPNNGIAMGMLAEHQGAVIVVTALIMILITAYIVIKRNKEAPIMLFSLCMIVAGGVGNLIDRLRLGYVVDYLDFRIWPYIFNFADICIVCGCFLLIFLVFRDAKSGEGGI